MITLILERGSIVMLHTPSSNISMLVEMLIFVNVLLVL